MKKDNVIITALSVGIVVVVAVTAFFLFQGSKKVTDTTDSTTAATAAATTASTEPAASESAVPATQTTATTAAETLKPTKTPKETKNDNTATPSPSPETGIADGTYTAYVTEASTNAPDKKSQGTISVQLANIYMGAEAIAQAKADGNADLIEIDENGVEYIPNDYYISDANKEIVVLPVQKDCSIRVIPHDGPDLTSEDYCVDGTLQNLADDAAEYQRFATITVKDGQVNYVGEFYLP
ncbi:MAG: hypothetical protein WCG21_04245 [Eubacteriales bacterium]